MNQRIVIKTALICCGIFILIIALYTYAVFGYFGLDTEKSINVMVAIKDLPAGTILNKSLVANKTIKVSAYSSNMLKDINEAENKKLTAELKEGDYLYRYLMVENTYSDDSKIITLPMEIKDRLGNLITKGSLIDIKVQLNNSKNIPQLVVGKVKVEQMIDENGLEFNSSSGGRKGFAKLILNKEQRDRVYAAQQAGVLLYELYIDSSQKPPAEEFVIPPDFYGAKNNKVSDKNEGASRGNQKNNDDAPKQNHVNVPNE